MKWLDSWNNRRKAAKIRRKAAKINRLLLRKAGLDSKIESWHNTSLVRGGGLPRSIVEELVEMEEEVAVINETLRQLGHFSVKKVLRK